MPGSEWFNSLTFMGRPLRRLATRLFVGPLHWLPRPPGRTGHDLARVAFLLAAASREYALFVLPGLPLVLPLVLALGCSGCLPGSELPDAGTAPPPPSCGSGRCEPSLGEDSLNCAQDCPPCWAVWVFRDGALANEAAGTPDGQLLGPVGEDDPVDLTFGREMQHGLTDAEGVSTTADLALVGEVMVTGPALEPTGGCPAPDGDYLSGAVQVLASAEGRDPWKVLGYWTKGAYNASSPATFSLACTTQLNGARYLRLVALPGAQFRLDAAHAVSCLQD